MTRGRIFTALGVLALIGLGLTVLMAANASGNREDPGAPKPRGNRLVFIGQVDTEEQMTSLYPKNFPMQSQVIEVLVKEGAKVKKDQPLLKFDLDMLELKVQEADAAIVAAQAEKSKAESAVRMHQTEVLSQEFTWKAKQKEFENKQSELKDAQYLLRLKAITQDKVDAAEAAVNAAELNLQAAKVKLDGLRLETPNYLVDQAKSNITRLQKLKAQAEQARDSMSCKAPADGRIIRSFVSAGHMFHPTSREPAFWFLKDGPPIVRGEVTQEFASRIAVGKSATIVDEADSKQEWTGKVSKVGDQFLQKRLGGASVLDFMPVSDDRVLECQVSIEFKPGETPPKFGQKMRISVE